MNLSWSSRPDSPSLLDVAAPGHSGFAARSFAPRRNSKSALVMALLACAALSMSGCKKKEPPPVEAPPVEAPPPPPPAVVSFDSISQELQAHAAVQFASGLEVTDESLVRATVKLADALARGDASKVRALVSKPAERLIRSMESSGVWEPGMSDVEAVRVVYAGPVDESANKITMEAVVEAMGAKQGSEIPGMTPELAYQVAYIMGKSMALEISQSVDVTKFTPENSEKMMKALQEKMSELTGKFLTDSKYEAARKEIEELIANLKGNAELPAGDFLVLFAVQHKDGAELSGWGAEKAFGKWQFNNGTTVADSKPRANEFDGIGLAGFSARLAEAPKADAEAKPGEGKPEDAKPEEDQPAKEGEPGPTKKRTPAGPVNIPGGG
ncbi:MAG: hypothetical protein H7210_08140 [Pyrinomonadaceae bacterium]|nr:hypothetical protein [Phycisphaerales bacterium]